MITNLKLWLRCSAVIVILGFTTACSAPILERILPPAAAPSAAPKDAGAEDALETVHSTETPTATFMTAKTPTSEPTVTLTPTPDWESIATQVAALPDTETWSDRSPNGKWITEGRAKTETGIDFGGYEPYYVQLRVISADQAIEWILVEEIAHFGLGYTTPEPLHWSQDGRFLYYTNRPHLDGCGLLVTGSDLWRVDLADGSLSQILPEAARSYAVSPDDSQVAYVTASTPPEVVLFDLNTGEERRVSLEFDDAGAILWSPDGTSLALTEVDNPCQPEWAHRILLVDADDLSMRTLVPLDYRNLETVEWQETGKILLKDLENNLWWLAVDSGELTQIQ